MKLYPYSDLHELNLDWVLEKVKEAEGLEDEIEEAIETAGAAEEAANNAAQAAQQATNLVQEAMEQIGEKASLDYVNQAVRTSSDFLSESINAVAADVDGKLDANKSAVAEVGGLVVPTNAPATDKLVGIDTTNGQELIGIGTGLAISGGNLVATGTQTGDVPTPTASDANKVLAVNGTGTDYGWTTSNAVQKVTNNNVVYGRIEGAEAALSFSTGTATPDTIVRRGTNGVIVTGIPTNNNHAATKKYVDDSIATVQPWPIALITLTDADTWSSTSDWTKITTAVTYGVIKFNAGGPEWYTPIYATNLTSSIVIKTFNGTNYTTYTINSDGTYTSP